MISRRSKHDVLIAGGGPVGLTLALALSRKGFQTAVIDARASDYGGSDRAYFVSHGCWRIWRALGLEAALLRDSEPVLSVEARGPQGGIAFLAEDQNDEPALGYMIEQNTLAATLTSAVEASENVSLIAGTLADMAFANAGATGAVDGEEIRASLMVGCDGARSAVREAAGIRFEGWDYPSRAISTTVRLARPHEGRARQVFLRGGPLAALPLRGARANLVWTERAPVADALMAMNDADFEAELAKGVEGFLAGMALAGPRYAFPVSLRVAERFHGSRVALAGDSAHLIHPLAGQGLNLGLKDVAALVDVIAEAARVGLDVGSEAALAPYTRWRRADVISTAAAMDGFARVFAGPVLVRALAGWAMEAVGSSRAARRLFAREAGGDLGELPSLMRMG
ncbi:MAG: FAD-dependent oxidoreductase [Alphaproteobacteria bacterium]|nr:FAD-dependent oxidoreductase [Alphaproteobacteria bacterium]